MSSICNQNKGAVILSEPLLHFVFSVHLLSQKHRKKSFHTMQLRVILYPENTCKLFSLKFSSYSPTNQQKNADLLFLSFILETKPFNFVSNIPIYFLFVNNPNMNLAVQQPCQICNGNVHFCRHFLYSHTSSKKTIYNHFHIFTNFYDMSV